MTYASRYHPLSRGAASAVFAAILLLADRATSTPWLPADQVGLIAHCDAKTASTERRACVAAAVAWRDQTRVAAAR